MGKVENGKYIPTETEQKLGDMLRKIVTDDDEYVGTMLALTVDQEDVDGNCQKMIDFLESNPNPSRDNFYDKFYEILGIEVPFDDEDEE